MNIISVLTTDHRNVDSLFKQFESTEPDDHEQLAHLRDLIIEQLAIHAAIEEQTLYPALRRASEEATDDVLESLEEHHAVKATLAELERMSPKAERFRAKMRVAIDNVRHHVEEEEGEGGVFALAREHLKQPQLEEMAERAEKLRTMGPNRPHPLIPDQPPFNVLLGLPVAAMDRAVTVVRHVVERRILHKAS
jgi:hemerythrin-like domain-containing protein